METIQATVNPRLLTKAGRLFTGTRQGRIIEILQNARRAGATKVDVTNEGGFVTVRDNGQGIENFARLLYQILEAALPAGLLDRIRLHQGPDLFVDVTRRDA